MQACRLQQNAEHEGAYVESHAYPGNERTGIVLELVRWGGELIRIKSGGWWCPDLASDSRHWMPLK